MCVIEIWKSIYPRIERKSRFKTVGYNFSFSVDHVLIHNNMIVKVKLVQRPSVVKRGSKSGRDGYV